MQLIPNCLIRKVRLRLNLTQKHPTLGIVFAALAAVLFGLNASTTKVIIQSLGPRPRPGSRHLLYCNSRVKYLDGTMRAGAAHSPLS